MEIINSCTSAIWEHEEASNPELLLQAADGKPPCAKSLLANYINTLLNVVHAIFN